MNAIPKPKGPPPRLAPHHDAVMQRIAAGEKYLTIGMDYGLTASSVARYARRFGIRGIAGQRKRKP